MNLKKRILVYEFDYLLETFSYLFFFQWKHRRISCENDGKYRNFNMGEIDKSKELYSKEGDNSSRYEGKQCHGGTHYKGYDQSHSPWCDFKGFNKFSMHATNEVSVSYGSKVMAKLKVFFFCATDKIGEKLDAFNFHSGHNHYLGIWKGFPDPQTMKL